MPALVAISAALVVLAVAKIVEFQLAQNSRERFAEDRLLILRGEGRLITYRLAGRAQKLRTFQQTLEKSFQQNSLSSHSLRSQLADFLKTDPGFNALVLASPDGSILAAAESRSAPGEKNAPPLPPPEPEELGTALSSSQTCVSPLKNFGNDTGVVFSSMVDLGPKGPAVLMARCPANWLLANLFTGSADNPGRQFIDHAGGIVLTAGRDMIWKQLETEADPEIFQHSSPGSHFRTSAGGDIILQHTVDVLHSDNYPSSVADLASTSPLRWSVVQRIPAETITNFGKLSAGGIWLVAGVALVALVPAAFYAARGCERTKKSRMELEHILSSLFHGILAVKVDPQCHDGESQLVITMANKEACRMLAGGNDLPLPLSKLRLPAGLDHWIRSVIDSGVPGTTELRLRDNPPLWVLVRAACSDGGAVISMADISQQKRDNENLQASENSLRLATRVAKLGLWMLEYPGPTVRWSQEVRRIHGVGDDYVPEVKSALSFYPPGARKQVAEAVAACEKDGRPMDLEVEFRDIAGRLLWVKIMAEREILPSGDIRIHGTFQDITESREAALALSENRERLSMAFQGGGMALVDRNLKTGQLSIDRNWCSKLGYLPEAAEAPNFWNELIVEDDQHSIQEGLRRYIDGNADFFEAEYRIRTHDGSSCWVIERSRAMEDSPSGTARHLVGVVFDITQQKETEGRLAKALEQEKELSRRAQSATLAKRDFLAMMSHEIRTPLNGILGFAEILSRKQLPDDDREAVETIRQSGETLLQIINDVLDYSRMDAGHLKLEPVVFDLAETVSFVVNLLQPSASAKGIRLDYELSPGVPSIVKLDPGRLKQILINLTGNAVKFTQHGSVHIQISPEGKDDHGRLNLKFSVTDTGIGIPPEQLVHIFEPFVQADASISRSHGGTGLGLAIARFLVRLMGGELDVASKRGTGSTFTFVIPVEVASPETGSRRTVKPHPEPLPLPPVHLNILVAEDDRVNARLTCLLLTKLGYAPRVASDGAQAVKMVFEEPPDLILMDVHMPRMDGIEATRRIREWEQSTRASKRILIAAFTADVLPEDRTACLQAGMDEVLLKPLQHNKLLTVLQKAAHAIDHARPPEKNLPA
ncbi:MAG: hypothetical protein Fur0032_09050 [Terrimicrobiaceae bacterium]